MKEQLKKKHSELRVKMKKHDEAILELLRTGPIDLISNIIKDYLSQHE